MGGGYDSEGLFRFDYRWPGRFSPELSHPGCRKRLSSHLQPLCQRPAGRYRGVDLGLRLRPNHSERTMRKGSLKAWILSRRQFLTFSSLGGIAFLSGQPSLSIAQIRMEEKMAYVAKDYSRLLGKV